LPSGSQGAILFVFAAATTLEVVMVQLKIVKIGNSLGVRLPREVLNRMHLGDGDKLILTEAPEGGYRLAPYDPEFERQMEIAEEGIRKYRNTLRELAK
jgi:putative addiction module antidote